MTIFDSATGNARKEGSFSSNDGVVIIEDLNPVSKLLELLVVLVGRHIEGCRYFEGRTRSSLSKKGRFQCPSHANGLVDPVGPSKAKSISRGKVHRK